MKTVRNVFKKPKVYEKKSKEIIEKRQKCMNKVKKKI